MIWNSLRSIGENTWECPDLPTVEDKENCLLELPKLHKGIVEPLVECVIGFATGNVFIGILLVVGHLFLDLLPELPLEFPYVPGSEFFDRIVRDAQAVANDLGCLLRSGEVRRENNINAKGLENRDKGFRLFPSLFVQAVIAPSSDSFIFWIVLFGDAMSEYEDHLKIGGEHLPGLLLVWMGFHCWNRVLDRFVDRSLKFFGGVLFLHEGED